MPALTAVAALAAGLAVGAGTAVAPQASAAPVPAVPVPAAVSAVVPGHPIFPATIEAFPRYEPETGCSPTAKPGALELQRILRVTYGASIASNIVRACTSKSSGHEEGRAIDWMVSQRKAAQRAQGDALVGWLLAADEYGNTRAMARRLGVQYVIWKSRILSFTGPATSWREYDDCLTARTTAADDTYCHRDHVHLSLTWAGAREQTTWYTLAGLPACTGAAALARRTLLAHGTLVPAVAVAATTVLDTSQGIGTPRLAVPCRLQSDGSLRVRTAGAGGVPASGVAQVRLRVTASAAGLATVVAPKDPVLGASRTAATGTTRSGAGDRPALDLQPGATATVTWWVRVNQRGEAALLLGPAVGRVTAAVVGYRLGVTGGDAPVPRPGSDGSPTTTIDVGSRHLP
jgi:hypothetical protein